MNYLVFSDIFLIQIATVVFTLPLIKSCSGKDARTLPSVQAHLEDIKQLILLKNKINCKGQGPSDCIVSLDNTSRESSRDGTKEA